MRKAVVAQSEVQNQTWRDMPIVVDVTGVIVVHPVLAGEIFQLRISAGHAQDEVDVGVFGKVTGVECGDSVGVELQFLVLVSVQPARTELELVAALCPRNVVAILETFVPILPGIVARAPRYVDRRTLS